MKVAYAIADKPEARRVESPRAGGRCNDYFFLLSSGSRDLVPMQGANEEQLAPFRASHVVETAVAEASIDIGQLGVDAAKRLAAEAPAELVQQIDVIIVCTAGLDSPFGVSIAGMFKHFFEAPKALTFMIGQMDGCLAFEALRIARAFLHGPEKARVVAVVTSERWWHPYLRSFGDYAQYGDGAAAMLLCAQDVSPEDGRTDGGLEIVGSDTGRYQAQRGPFDLQEPRWFNEGAWPEAVGNFLAGFLRKHEVSAADLMRIDSPCLGPAFIDAVARASDLPLSPGTGGFVSSVDPMLSFCAPASGEHAVGYILSWSVGLNGEMGACLLRHGNRAPASTRESI